MPFSAHPGGVRVGNHFLPSYRHYFIIENMHERLRRISKSRGRADRRER
jgi:hypothetical protein